MYIPAAYEWHGWTVVTFHIHATAGRFHVFFVWQTKAIRIIGLDNLRENAALRFLCMRYVTGHGVKSSGLCNSSVPCLNCYRIVTEIGICTGSAIAFFMYACYYFNESVHWRYVSAFNKMRPTFRTTEMLF